MARYRQEAAALGAVSSPPPLQRLQLGWAGWREARSRLGSSPGSKPVTLALPAPSVWLRLPREAALGYPPGGGRACCTRPRPLQPVRRTPPRGAGLILPGWAWGKPGRMS